MRFKKARNLTMSKVTGNTGRWAQVQLTLELSNSRIHSNIMIHWCNREDLFQNSDTFRRATVLDDSQIIGVDFLSASLS